VAPKGKRFLKKPTPLHQKTRAVPEGCLTGNLDHDSNALKQLIRDAGDLEYRLVYTQGHRHVALFYYADMVNLTLVSRGIIHPLQQCAQELDIAHIAQSLLNVPAYKQARELARLAEALAEGSVVLLFQGLAEALILGVSQIEHRVIERSESEDVLMGPHESFSEQLGRNLALMRSRLATPAFKNKFITLGKVSRSKVAVMFIDGIVSEDLVAEVEERLLRIDIDYISGAGHVSELLSDEPTAVLPLLRITERPSRVAGALMEGRVVVLADGDPSAIIIPTFAAEYLQSSEDYLERPAIASFLRFIRFGGLIISVFLPGLWHALVSFHHGIIPPPLFNSIVAGREGVPLPTVVEMIVLLLTYDIIVEASTRMPMRIGQALGIVGGIILGQAAVQAGLVSPAMVIIVSLTGLSTFTQPSVSILGPLRLLKYPMLVASSIFGLFGLMWALVFMVLQVVSMRSFGYPFMYPLAPFRWRGELDIFIRIPLFWLSKRPDLLAGQNQQRMNITPPYPGKGEQDGQSRKS